VGQVLPERPTHPRIERQHEGGDAIQLLKIREGDIAHGLPVNPKLNRIRFDEAADDLQTEYAVNGRRSADELERQIRRHLLPSFGGRRLASITTADVNAFILKRQKDVMLIGDGDERKQRKYSNGEINRELTTLKRILNLARQNGKLMHVPYVPMLKERTVRTGFQADDAGFEVDVPPLELQNLARDPPARDIGEPHRWTDGRRQASEDALDLLALEDPLGVRALQHRERVRPRGGETRRNTLDRQLLRRDEEYPCSHGLERPRTELVPRFND
jgi:hypothetical protein